MPNDAKGSPGEHHGYLPDSLESIFYVEYLVDWQEFTEFIRGVMFQTHGVMPQLGVLNESSIQQIRVVLLS